VRVLDEIALGEPGHFEACSPLLGCALGDLIHRSAVLVRWLDPRHQHARIEARETEEEVRQIALHVDHQDRDRSSQRLFDHHRACACPAARA
jgi:hypothetical protein